MKASDYKLCERGASFRRLDPTPPDILGPFYLPNAPMRQSLAPLGNLNLTIKGQVLSTKGEPVIGALIEVWQADAAGNYDNDPSSMQFRGNQYSSLNKGSYVVETIIPGDYKISDPGEPDDFRCAHIHFKITTIRFKQLVTQLYFPDDKYNATDHWFDARRVITPPNATFNFVLEESS